MRIGLLGQFGSGNSGNDGSLEAMVRFLRRAHPGAELVCICSRPAVVSNALDIAATGISAASLNGRVFTRMNELLLSAPQRFLNVTEAFRTARGFDWMIVPGTGILDDFRENPFGWPFVLWRWCAAARLNGARIALVSIGAGPIHHPLSRRFMTSAARLASYRSYRDEISRDYMAGIGFDVSRDQVFPDIAFGLPAPQPTTVIPRRDLTVGIGVMSYRGWLRKNNLGEHIYQTYLSKLARFALVLLRRGYHLRLLTGDAADWAAVEDFFQHLAHLTPRRFQTRITAEKAASLSELMTQLRDTDVVVATRYHNIVCALKLGLPAISLSYAEKNDALLSECGLAEFCQNVETFDVGTLIGQFSRLVADRKNRSHQIRASVAKILDELSRQEVELSALLCQHSVGLEQVKTGIHYVAGTPPGVQDRL